jgi:hypothetical protein
MYRMSIMTMMAPPSLATKINIPHCTKMALIHDMVLDFPARKDASGDLAEEGTGDVVHNGGLATSLLGR